jgi:hypothetical protein
MVINNATADAATNLFISATPSSRLSIVQTTCHIVVSYLNCLVLQLFLDFGTYRGALTIRWDLCKRVNNTQISLCEGIHMGRKYPLATITC